MDINKMFESNMGLVGTAIKQYYKGCIGISAITEYDDLQAIGYIGLFRACKNFDESKGYKFSTYAMKCICGEIRRYLRDRVFGRNKCNVRTTKTNVYIDNLVKEDGKKTTFESLLGSETDDYSEMELKIMIDNMDLKERDKQILKYRMEGKNQTEIAKLVGVNQVSVSRSLKKIKEMFKEEIA